MKFHNEDTHANIERRDLTQFVSPNPRTTQKALYLKETSTLDLQKTQDQWESWSETENLSCLIIDTSTCVPLKDENYLTALKEVLSCPVIRLEDIREKDQIFDACLLGFDGLITSISHLSARGFHDTYKLAEAQQFLVIPSLAKKEDWQIIAAAIPKFLNLASEAATPLPPFVKESGCYVMGRQDMAQNHILKIMIEEVHRV